MKHWVLLLFIVVPALCLTACNNRESPEEKRADLEKKAAGGNAMALYCLGLMHEQGYGVTANKYQAALCYKNAAEKGQVQAQYRLGFLYYHGQGVPRDLEKAAEWYKKAAEQGDQQAQEALGNMYLSGEGVPQDSAKAAFWLKKSSKIKK